ncbi:hypothetical protein ABBQ38_009245 [Trebouxia sp. C0009 RCD-2024]
MLLERITLDAIGRPLLSAGEYQEAELDQAQIGFETTGTLWPEGNEGFQDNKMGRAILTSHRLIWADTSAFPRQGCSCQVPLSTVHEVQLKASMMLRSPKLRVHVYLDEHSKPAQDQKGSVRVEQLKLVAPHMTSFLDSMRSALQSRLWERSQAAESSGQPHTSSPLAAVAPGSSSAAMDESLVDSQLVGMLVAMGFPKHRAVRAALETGNTGPEQAVHWLAEHEQDYLEGDPAAPPPVVGSSPVPSVRLQGAGVAGILRREAQLAARNDESLEEAFKDLRGLMAKAAEMVDLAERFRTTMAAQRKAAQQGAGEGGQQPDAEAQQWMDTEMQAELVNMGIASPVTKAESGALYHQDLSRQLGDFLGPKVDKAGGMMAMADVYCLFNRARGSELVSPDDLLQACSCFSQAGVPLSLKQFSTGALVVQSRSHSTGQVCARIGELVTADEGLGPAVTASDVASALVIPLPIASEHLLTAENRGVLCRDDGPEGLRFFRNFFTDIATGA